MRPSALLSLAAVAATVAACAGAPPGPSARAPTRLAAQDASLAPVAPERHARLTPPGGKPTLDTLPGMRGAELTTLMGAPQFRRRDGQAEIWQYRGSACTLDVFLYTDGGDLRVRYVEARGRADGKQTTEAAQARACAGTLLDARAGGAG